MWETEVGRGRFRASAFQFGSLWDRIWEGRVLGSRSSWRCEASQASPFVPPPQLDVSLEEIPDEGLLVSWAFTDRPDLSLTVLPKLQAREVRGQGSAEEAEQGGGAKLGAPPPYSPFLPTERRGASRALHHRGIDRGCHRQHSASHDGQPQGLLCPWRPGK